MYVWFPEGPDGLLGTLRRSKLTEVDDSGTQQIVKKLSGLKSDLPEDIYRPQSHGLTSVPPPDSEGLLLALGGRSDRLLALGYEHKDKRPRNLPSGAVALYDADGKILKIIKDGTSLDAGGKPVTVTNVDEFTVTASSKLRLKVGDTEIVITSGRIWLGKEGEGAKVATEDGLSSIVYAKV